MLLEGLLDNLNYLALRRFNKHHILYVMWLFLLLNVFQWRNTPDLVVEKAVVLKRIDRSVLSRPDTKKILLWNPWYGDFGFAPDDEFAFRRANCKVSNCVLSKNKTTMPPEEADAVVFLYTNLCELPKLHGRKEYQRYVLLTDDPPSCYARNYFERDNIFGSFFNWTISYRENADIVWKRGWIEKLAKPLKKNSVQQSVFIPTISFILIHFLFPRCCEWASMISLISVVAVVQIHNWIIVESSLILTQSISWDFYSCMTSVLIASG